MSVTLRKDTVYRFVVVFADVGERTFASPIAAMECAFGYGGDDDVLVDGSMAHDMWKIANDALNRKRTEEED